MYLFALFMLFQSALRIGGGGVASLSTTYTPPPTNEGVTVTNPPFSYYGYPQLVMPGADREEYKLVYGETDHPTTWSTDGSGNIVIHSPGHHMQVADYVVAQDFTAAGQFVNSQAWYVNSVTTDTYTLNSGTSGSGVSGTETTATVKKVFGPDYDPLGTWSINVTTACGGASQPACPKFRIYTQDETQDTGFVTSPSVVGIPPYMNWGVDPSSIGGDCSYTGSIITNNLAIHSTIEFDVKFVSADNPLQPGNHHYALCKVGGGFAGIKGKLQYPLGFRTVYKNRYIPIVSQVFGNTNQMVNWTIDSAPAGGDASLLYPTYPQPVFKSGAVSGLYGVKGCPAVDSSPAACGHISVWVSPNDPPAANTDKVEQVPCDTGSNMGITWGSIYDIKPGTATPDLLSIPQNPVGSVLIRVWNTGANGSPTEYHNQLQVNLPSGGPFSDTHPAVFMCGVANSTTGELPIIDGANATVNSWASPFVVGPYSIIGFFNPGNNSAPYNGQQQPFSFVSVEGFHVRNITGGYTYQTTTGGTGTWGESMGIRPYGIEHWAQIGMFVENVANPFFDDCNTHQSGWAQCTISTLYEGSRLNGYGYLNSYLDHPFYLQAEGGEYSLLNNVEGAEPQSQGTGMYSDRGYRSWHMYERAVPVGTNTMASGLGGHSDCEDCSNYVTDDEFWGYQGAASCSTEYSTAPACQGITGVNVAEWFTALQEEHSKTDFVIGNIYSQPYAGTKMLGIAITHGTASFRGNLSSQWGRLSLNQYIAFNTFYIPPAEVNAHGMSLLEDVRLDEAGDTSLYNLPQSWPRFYLQNNIIPLRDNTNCAYNCATFGTSGTTMVKFGKNLVNPGQVTITNPLYYTGWSGGGIFQSGINQAVSYWQYGNINPLNRHIAGFNAANFPTFSTFPFNTTTFIPQAGSAAIGNAAALTGELAYYPPRFNPPTTNMDPFTLRVDLTTMGAVDPEFSASLQAYPNMVTTQTASSVVTAISNPAYTPTTAEASTRLAVAQMYLNAGFDISYDNSHDISDGVSSSLLSLAPTTGISGSFNKNNPALSFSPDAPFYHKIPASTPKVQLPANYFPDTQVNSARGPDSDGIGYGETVAASSDPNRTVTSQWYSDTSTLRTFPFKMSASWSSAIPANAGGDRHVIFIDPFSQQAVSTYTTSVNSTTLGPQALYASDPTSIIGMGDRGGSNAAKFADLPVMIQPGELTDPVNPIKHALGGPILHTWGGRVYPAYARDDGMLTSVNTCTGTGQMDTGIVPFGALLQLDPTLNVNSMSISLPAKRILQAMQTYGYYVMDFGCTDFDIYTAIDETELEPIGGMYGNANGPGVQNEVKSVVSSSNWYVVPPLVKH